MADNGYIKLFRTLLSWEWIDKPETLSVWIYLLLSANHCNNEWHGITVKRGQIITSYPSISKKTGLSVQQARTAINRLKSTGEITHEKTNRYSLITIVNYEFFQGDNNAIINSQATVKQQSSNSKQE